MKRSGHEISDRVHDEVQRNEYKRQRTRKRGNVDLTALRDSLNSSVPGGLAGSEGLADDAPGRLDGARARARCENADSRSSDRGYDSHDNDNRDNNIGIITPSDEDFADDDMFPADVNGIDEEGRVGGSSSVAEQSRPGRTNDDSLSVGISVHGDENGLICYGMVPSIKCQRLSIADHIAELDVSEDEVRPTYVSLEYAVKRGRLTLGTSLCPDLAHMNSKATFVLLEALKLGASLQLFVKSENLELFSYGDDDGKKTEYLFVDANVLGPDAIRQDTGALLSRHTLYLQTPQVPDPHMGYSNPHIMQLDVSEFDILFQELALGLTASADSSPEATDWNVVLDNLPRQHNFNSVATEINKAVVTTRTMDHQREALDFMCTRELGVDLIENDLRYWQLDRNEDGVPVYRHTVTADEECQPQPEPQGGILADDMGLGKTLTSISLIACSQERAVHFTQDFAKSASHDTEILPRSRATLVVVPSTQLMDSWTKELEKHTQAGSLKISKYHGQDRVRHFSDLLDNDIVLTTYGTIANEHRKTRRQVLYHMKFFRIVLDEAHTIRSRRTKLFKAVTALDAAHHWCLTGTPIANRVDDLGALLDFCRVPLLGDNKCFQQYVTAVTKKSLRRGYAVLQETLKPICLRRTRAVLKIAQPKAIEKEVVLSYAERKHYERIMRRSRKAIDDAVSGRTGTSSRNTMLKVLLELRIFCNQGTFTPEKQEALDADEQLTLLEEREDAVCDKCRSIITMLNQLEDPTSGVLGLCAHKLCRPCYDDLEDEDQQPNQYTCPVCDTRTGLEGADDSEQSQALGSASQHSSKLNALIKDLTLSQNGQKPEKSIVFSVWRKTLDTAELLCARHGIRTVRVDGKTPQSERSSLLQQFTHDPNTSTLLMTMGTGALGLNLTAASRIHILEPQWNPAVEDQAIGRAVRLGQAKDTTVIRYIVRDSVEKQIQGYQRRKRRLAGGGFEQRYHGLPIEEDSRLTV